MSNWKVREELINQKVIMAYKGLIPTKEGPGFFNVQVKILEDMEDSVWVEQIEGGNLVRMQVPKDSIQHFAFVSEVGAARGLVLPNFRS